MNVYKKIIKSLTSPRQRVQIIKWKRHIKSFFKGGRKTTLEELKRALVNELEIKAGDRILVTSSFGNLNADYTPQDVVRLLMEIVTEDGNIMMPYYPPVNSTIWAKEGKEFDMNSTPSGMGILTNVFSKTEGVVMSCHPTKAVCIWGKNAAQIAQGHESSTTPYFWDSPYGKLLKMGSKSVGLGLKHIPMGHAMEDILSTPHSYFYQKDKYRLHVIRKDRSQSEVETLVHDDDILDKCVDLRDYAESLKAKSYKKIDFGLAVLYSVDNTDIMEEMSKAFDRGYTRIIDNKKN